MRWTKKHSANAVAKKARLRLERAEADPVIPLRRKLRLPRSKARFTLTMEDHEIGDKIRLSLYRLPWPGRFVTTGRKEVSTARICEMVRAVLNHD